MCSRMVAFPLLLLHPPPQHPFSFHGGLARHLPSCKVWEVCHKWNTLNCNPPFICSTHTHGKNPSCLHSSNFQYNHNALVNKEIDRISQRLREKWRMNPLWLFKLKKNEFYLSTCLIAAKDTPISTIDTRFPLTHARQSNKSYCGLRQHKTA